MADQHLLQWEVTLLYSVFYGILGQRRIQDPVKHT